MSATAALLTAFDRFLEAAGAVSRQRAKRRALPLSEAAMPETWRLVHTVADLLAPDLKAAFLQAVANLGAGVAYDALVLGLENQSIAQAEAAVPLADFGAVLEGAVRPILAQAATQAAQAALPSLPADVRLKMDFAHVNPAALDWAQAHAAELVREVSEQTRLGLRQSVADAFTNGQPPRELAKIIRRQIGLTQRGASAVESYRTQLLADGTAPERVDLLAGQYTHKLINDRAELISRTETLAASNQGQQALWQGAAEQGLIDRSTTRRRWIATPSERTCESCMAADGQEVGLDEPFEVGGESVMVPPAHPACRCSAALAFPQSREAAVPVVQEPAIRPVPLPPNLSSREREVLRLIAEGYTERGVACALCISEHTVNSHTRAVFSALGAHSRAQAVALAKDLGLLS